MNPAYEYALKEVGNSWKAANFVASMLARARITYPIDPTPASFTHWGHPIEAPDMRPGDVVVTTRGGTPIAVFFGRRMGAFAECLGVSKEGSVERMRLPMSRFISISRPPRPAPANVTPLVAEFVQPGAMSKPVAVRKADPLPPPTTPAPQAFVPKPQPKPRFGVGWIFATLVAGLTLAAAKIAEMF